MRSTLDKQKNNTTGLAWKDLINALKPKDIEVSVNNGDVLLKGTVNSYQKKTEIEKIVEGIAGVRSITNEITIRFSNVEKVKDLEIKDAVLEAITYINNTTEKAFNMKIEGEWLIIEGEVENVLGNKIRVSGRVCKLEESRAQLNVVIPAKETKNEGNKELAYWEVFG